MFGRSAPLRLEMGFGNGEFLEASALENPEVDWVGIELSWGSTRRLLKRLESRAISNVRVVQADATLALERLFDADSLDQVIINNSDPWPKPRHHRRRLIQPRFVDLLAARLKPNSQAIIVTDHAEYASWISEILEDQICLRSAFAKNHVEHLPGHHPTKYKRKGLEAGSVIHYFVWKKVKTPDYKPSEQNEVDEMPNVLLRGETDFNQIFSGFEPRVVRTAYREEPVLLQLIEPYRSMNRKSWLVEARVSESGFVQHILLSVAQKKDGMVLIKPSAIGAPRPTWGVRQLVAQLAGWLTEQHPGLQIHSSSVGEPEETASSHNGA